MGTASLLDMKCSFADGGSSCVREQLGHSHFNPCIPVLVLAVPRGSLRFAALTRALRGASCAARLGCYAHVSIRVVAFDDLKGGGLIVIRHVCIKMAALEQCGKFLKFMTVSDQRLPVSAYAYLVAGPLAS